jgi:hypothetical protein
MGYSVGDAVPVAYTISDSATVVCTVTDPDGVTSNPTLDETGAAPAVTYSGVFAATTAGVWLVRFVATGAVTDAEDAQVYVAPTLTANAYTTLPELKVALSLPVADVADDDDLQDAIAVASRQVDADCGRHFYQVTEARTFPATDLIWLRLGEYGDLVSVTSLKTDPSGDGTFETTWDPADYQLLCADGTPNVNAGPEPRPYRRIKAVAARTFPVHGSYRTNLVEVTGTWGWPQVPDRVRRAARVMAAEVFKLRDAPFGAVGMADLGIIRVRENPKYLRLIADYRLYPVPVA